MAPPPLNALQAFVAVARRASFSAAARELGVSASALSQAVRRLEERLGVVLLHRTSRSVSLTDEGRRLLEGAGGAVDQALSALSQATARPDQVSGPLRLTVPTATLPTVMERLVPAFVQRHPTVTLDLRVEDAFVDIVAAGLDAGVRLRHSVDPEMVSVPLHGPCRVVVAGAPSYLGRRGTPQTLDELLEHDCIGVRFTPDGPRSGWLLGQGSEQRRIPVRGPVVTGDRELALALAIEGVGLIRGLDTFLAEPLARGDLRLVLEPYARPVEGIFLYHPTGAAVSPALRAFIDLAQELTP